MKVVFVGPTLAGTPAAAQAPGELALRPPARRGDILWAALEGATAIGLVDGVFESVAAVWHKEILFALSRGIHVAGAASMGALRAAECAAYGMVGIGTIFERYASGELVDDDAVAQIHAPPELGSAPLSEALVNVQASFDRLLALGLLGEDERRRLEEAAHGLFFKERTYDRILDAAGVSGARRSALLEAIRLHGVDLKRQDAEALLRHMAAWRAPPQAVARDWQLAESAALIRLLEEIDGGRYCHTTE